MICQSCGKVRHNLHFGYCDKRCFEGPRAHPLWMAWRNIRYGNFRYAWWDVCEAWRRRKELDTRVVGGDRA